jgi:hypothetical protein
MATTVSQFPFRIDPRALLSSYPLLSTNRCEYTPESTQHAHARTHARTTPTHHRHDKTTTMSSSLDAAAPPFNAGESGAAFLSTSCLDFLMIELVPLAHRVTQQLDAGHAAPAQGLSESSSSSGGGGVARSPLATTTTTAGAGQTPSPISANGTPTAGAGAAAGAGGAPPPPDALTTTTATTAARKLDEDEERDAVHRRLEALGYRVGQGVVERFSRDRPRFHDTLDVIKFLCKDVWLLAFGKQVDNLKTNHRGVYVLTDTHFRPISRMSTEPGGQAVVRAKPFLCYPAGIVRGALAALGITATVQAETTDLPAAVFHIKTTPPKS